MIYIDFETRSRIDLKKSGAWRYAEDESTIVLCMAYTDGKSDDVFLWTPEMEPFMQAAEIFRKEIEQGNFFIAHNAGFERVIYENIMVKRHGFPRIPGHLWRCSAAKAAAHAIPRGLADACGALALPMQKDSAGHAVMMKLAKPRKHTKNDKRDWHNDAADFEKLYAYCRQDIRSEIGLYERLPDLSEHEQRVWLLDQEINIRGIRVDMETVHAAIHLIREYNEELTAELNEITDQVIGSADEREKIVQWCALNGLELPNLQAGQVEDTLSEELPPHVKNPEKVRRVLEIRKQLAKTSTAKYEAITLAVCADGRLRDLLMYHGASTGRWAGKGVQPQNLPRNTSIKDVETAITLVRRRNLAEFRLCYEDPMETLAQLLRAMFIASPGKIMVGGDYAQIEARVLFWLSGETLGLRMFERGDDLYLALAHKIYNNPNLTKENSEERQVGKSGTLGCGFGMGHKKFREDTERKTGIDVGEEMAKVVVDTYRKTYPNVVKFWYAQEAAAIEAVKKGTMVTCGKIKWKVFRGFLYCRLPSGRCLAYCHPKVEIVDTPWGDKKEGLTFMQVNSTTKKWERGKTYGGALTENIVQAVARDIMADAMLRAEDMNFQVLLTVHDELITEQEYLDHVDASKILKTLMENAPSWAEGLPVKAETWEGYRYAK